MHAKGRPTKMQFFSDCDVLTKNPKFNPWVHLEPTYRPVIYLIRTHTTKRQAIVLGLPPDEPLGPHVNPVHPRHNSVIDTGYHCATEKYWTGNVRAGTFDPEKNSRWEQTRE